jgi:hypothetical protein
MWVCRPVLPLLSEPLPGAQHMLIGRQYWHASLSIHHISVLKRVIGRFPPRLATSQTGGVIVKMRCMKRSRFVSLSGRVAPWLQCMIRCLGIYGHRKALVKEETCGGGPMDRAFLGGSAVSSSWQSASWNRSFLRLLSGTSDTFRTRLSSCGILRDAVCEGEGTQDDERREAAQDGINCRHLVQPLVAVSSSSAQRCKV